MAGAIEVTELLLLPKLPWFGLVCLFPVCVCVFLIPSLLVLIL
jgi:hypothetical protein